MSRLLSEVGPIKCITSDTRLTELAHHWTVQSGTGHEGDLVLFEMRADDGAYRTLQDALGRNLRMYAGDLAVGVLGNRESGEALFGRVPPEGVAVGPDSDLHVLTDGGIVGRLLCSPSYQNAGGVQGVPVRPLGLVTDNGSVVDTLRLSLSRDVPTPDHTAALVLVTATATSAGKTALLTQLIRRLARRHDMRVAATRLAGTGSLEGILQATYAGATWSADLPDVGLPSTYTSAERYRKRIPQLLDRLDHHRPDVIVAELGGDILWANSPTLLRMPLVMDRTASLVLLAQDSVGSIGAMHLLEEWGVSTPVHLVNSPLRNPLASKVHVAEYLGRTSFGAADAEALDALTRAVVDDISAWRATR